MSRIDDFQGPEDINSQIDKLKKQAVVEMGRKSNADKQILEGVLNEMTDTVGQGPEISTDVDLAKSGAPAEEYILNLHVLKLQHLGVNSQTAERLIAALLQQKRILAGGNLQ